MRRSIVWAAVALLTGYSAYAAPIGPGDINPPPFGVTSGVGLTSTILISNAFQIVFPFVLGVNRNGCSIQDTGSSTMFVYVHQNGTGGTASSLDSYQLIPPATGVQGGTFNCATGAGGVIQDEIDITGTAGDTFTARVQ